MPPTTPHGPARGRACRGTALVGLLLVGCASFPAPLRMKSLRERAWVALERGDTKGLYRVAQDMYRRHGVAFDRSLRLVIQPPHTLSSFYLEAGNQIVLARAAPGDGLPPQLRALSSALFYARSALPSAGDSVEQQRLIVNQMVLILAAHELAHYLRAQYFSPPQNRDHFAAEQVCNRLAISLVRELAAGDPKLESQLVRATAFFERLAEAAPKVVSAYPPPGERAGSWFNRHYGLLLRHEPGIYFVFQLRWWLRFLRAKERAPLGGLVRSRILEPARRYLARVELDSVGIRVRTVRTIDRRVPADVLAVGPGGKVLIDVEGRLLELGSPRPNHWAARKLPYGEGYRSNYAVWPRAGSVYAFRWARGRLRLYEIRLHGGGAHPAELANLAATDRILTMSSDASGTLYLLARARRHYIVHRYDAKSRRLSVLRRFPVRPAGHRDGPIAVARFTIGAFTVWRNRDILFYDPGAFAMRKLDGRGRVTTLGGSYRGFRDGDEKTARFGRVSHLSGFGDGLFFLEEVGGSLKVRRLELDP